jgi:outer membrane protein OmpA-like peptidoglycan-associated protein
VIGTMHAWSAAGAALLALAVAGCVSTPDPFVEEARERVQNLRDDPVVQEYASVRLYEAEQALESMEQAERDETKRHRAFIVHRRVELARVAAEDGRLLQRSEELAEARDELRLAARQAEAERARELAAQRGQQLTEAERLAAERQERLSEAERLATARGEQLEEIEARAQSAESRAEALEGEIAELETQQTSRGLVLTLNGLLFATDRADLQAGETRALDRLATFLKEYPERNIVIEGHTDAAGPAGYNESLSLQRAQAVTQYLVEQGVERERIETRGLGEAFPVTTNETPAGRQQNRRVEIVMRNEEMRRG